MTQKYIERIKTRSGPVGMADRFEGVSMTSGRMTATVAPWGRPPAEPTLAAMDLGVGSWPPLESESCINFNILKDIFRMQL